MLPQLCSVYPEAGTKLGQISLILMSVYSSFVHQFYLRLMPPSIQLGTSLSHVTNQEDPVPSVPPRFLDYVHPSGEIHIKSVDTSGDATDIVACPGQENESCSEGNSLFDASIPNHLGMFIVPVILGEYPNASKC